MFDAGWWYEAALMGMSLGVGVLGATLGIGGGVLISGAKASALAF